MPESLTEHEWWPEPPKQDCETIETCGELTVFFCTPKLEEDSLPSITYLPRFAASMSGSIWHIHSEFSKDLVPEQRTHACPLHCHLFPACCWHLCIASFFSSIFLLGRPEQNVPAMLLWHHTETLSLQRFFGALRVCEELQVHMLYVA